MNLQYPIYTEKTECQDCYKCIRLCPVKAIRVENGHAIVVPELCIMCGRCVTSCPAKAKHIRDDTSKTKELLKSGRRVIASLAPSFVAEFSDYSSSQIISALKKLGFWGVSETALGAEFVSDYLTKKIKEDQISKKEQNLYLSSACPSIVEYVKQFLPSLKPYITDCASPVLAHARFLKKYYGDDIAVVFIGPCIAKKIEADVWDEIDSAITFIALKNWLEEELISPENCGEVCHLPCNQCDKFDFIPVKAAQSSLYSSDGGMIEALKKYGFNANAFSISGIKEVKHALKDLKPKSLKEPLFLELLACSGGCINGSGCNHVMPYVLKRLKLFEYVEKSPQKIPDGIFKTQIDLTGTLPVDTVKQVVHSQEEIKTFLRSIGKFSQKDELNCASCGYDNCRKFAEAVLDKRAEKTMCVSYMRKLAQKKANGLIRAIPGGVVIVDNNLKIIECNENFARMLGGEVISMYEEKPGMEGVALENLVNYSRFFADVIEVGGPDVIKRDVKDNDRIFRVSVFAIEKDETAGGVILDVTAPEVHKQKIISQAEKVIDKNLSVVQQIAFLLGENAAETEAMLNSIVESFTEGDDEQ